jgi:hypothetical protein
MHERVEFAFERVRRLVLTELDTRDTLKTDLAGVVAVYVRSSVAEAEARSGFRLGGLAFLVARHYLRWEAVVDEPEVAASGLSEPYEPLIRLFERGGELFTHHGFIHVNHGGCFYPNRLRDYAELPALEDLSDSALDSIDKGSGL